MERAHVGHVTSSVQWDVIIFSHCNLKPLPCCFCGFCWLSNTVMTVPVVATAPIIFTSWLISLLFFFFFTIENTPKTTFVVKSEQREDVVVVYGRCNKDNNRTDDWKRLLCAAVCVCMATFVWLHFVISINLHVVCHILRLIWMKTNEFWKYPQHAVIII